MQELEDSASRMELNKSQRTQAEKKGVRKIKRKDFNQRIANRNSRLKGARKNRDAYDARLEEDQVVCKQAVKVAAERKNHQAAEIREDYKRHTADLKKHNPYATEMNEKTMARAKKTRASRELKETQKALKAATKKGQKDDPKTVDPEPEVQPEQGVKTGPASGEVEKKQIETEAPKLTDAAT